MKKALMVCFVAVLCACTKTENVGLVGIWQLSEVYDGYVNGGSFTWNKVDAANTHTLTFSNNSGYTKQGAQAGSAQICTGTYQQITTDTLQIVSSCQTTVQKIKISELSGRILILDYQGREGIIRYKYRAAK